MFEGKRWWRIEIRIDIEQNTLLHWNEGVWVYVHTRSARKDPLRNPREIQVDQRGQHVRRRLLTPKRTPPSATQWSNIVLRIMLRDINVVLHDTGCATWHMNCNICTVRPTVRSQTPALRWEHRKRQRSKLSATRAHDHWGYHAFRTLEVRTTE